MAKFRLTLNRVFEIDTTKIDELDNQLRKALKEQVGWDPKEGEPSSEELHDAMRQVISDGDLNDQTIDCVDEDDYQIEVVDATTNYVAEEVTDED